MCSKQTKEWFVDVPWGKIAMISWGNPVNAPILLSHGYMDTVATFTFLIDKLPNDYYYVGFDIPGHGKSDSFPSGVHITQFHLIQSMRLVVEHMKWKTFIYLSHSMSFQTGIFYNNIYPGYIEKMIFIDPKPALVWYYVIHHHHDWWYKRLYSTYYDNYHKLNFGKPKLQSYEMWINSVAHARNLTKEQSEIVMSRSLIPVTHDAYRLSWDPRVRHMAHAAMSTDALYTIMTTKLPPTLVINASEFKDFINVPPSKPYATSVLNDCEQNLPLFYQVTVMGNHDLHITNPDPISGHIENFLQSSNLCVHEKSKL